MQAQNVTPEERLLRLIESADEGGREFVFWNVRTWPILFFPYREKARRLVRTRFAAGFLPRELNIRVINRGLVVALVLLAVAIALNATKVGPSPQDLSSQVASRPPSGADQASTPLRPVEDYLRAVEKRDFFNLVPPPKPENPAPKAEPTTPPKPADPPKPSPRDILREKAKTLKLVGIAWKKPPVAMIEDTVKGETSFLKAGQSINEIRIKAILRDRAILSYEGAEYDLF